MRYDITIVGGRPTEYMTAERAAAGGLKAVLFEKKVIGGVRLSKGCTPIKALLYSAKLWNTMKSAAEYGTTAPDAPVFDMGRIIDRRGKVTGKLTGGVKMTVGPYGVAIVEREAVIAGEENGVFRIVAGDETYEATYLLACTGSDTVIPPILGLSGTDYWTSKEALESKEFSRSLIIIGGGVIGTELASFFNNMGVKVSVVEMMPEILGAMGRETVGMLRPEYPKCGVNFYLGTRVTVVSHEGVVVKKDGKVSLTGAGKTSIGAGRKADLDQTGLDKLNVELSRNGVKADEHMQTSHLRVYACGDIIGCSMLMHTATRESEVAVNYTLGVEDAVNYDYVPGVVYTNPEVAGMGKIEEELKALGTSYHVQKLLMTYSGHSVAENELDNGLCKLVLDDDNRIINCRLLDNPASGIIVVAGIVVQHGYTAEEFQKSVFSHPTMGEILHETLST